MKSFILVISLLSFIPITYAGMGPMYMMTMDDPTPDPEPSIPPGSPPKGPSNNVNGIKGILNGFNSSGGNMFGGGSNFNNNPDGSGDFGFDNLRLNGGFSFSSFDDSTAGSSGHFREYSLTLSADLTETDILNIGLSQTRYETGGSNHILARTQGISLSWIHQLTDNYGVGAFAMLNDVDIEEINGNSYSYGYGLLFTTYHSFEFFDLSSATAIAHTDFDTGYDQFIMSAWTVSKQWNDQFGTYLTLTFFDSFKDDPDGDPTYGTWEIGGTYLINDNLSLSLGFQRTEFLNNYSDNTLLLNVGYFF